LTILENVVVTRPWNKWSVSDLRTVRHQSHDCAIAVSAGSDKYTPVRLHPDLYVHPLAVNSEYLPRSQAPHRLDGKK